MKMILKVLAVGLFLSLCGCGDDPTSTAPKSSPQKVRTPKAQVLEVVVVDAEPREVFSYSSIGQRDPFVSLLKKEADSKQADIPKTPLEKFDLGQFRVQAILIGKGAPRAMVSAPDGKNYILKPGLKIGKNNGMITEINKNSIIIEESTIDLAGNRVKGFQSLTIPEKKTL